jgi:hypothetical protein
MDTNLIWWSGVALDVAILLRGGWTGLFRKYPLFYVYICCVVVKEVIGLLAYELAPGLYAPLYWPTELATVLASYAVIVEIFRQVLKHNPGAARLVQNLLLLLFAFMLVYASFDILRPGSLSLPRAIVELARDLRYVEGALLLIMLSLFVRYRISVSSNLSGLVFGYAFWVGINIITLALWFLPGNELSVRLRTLLPLSYNVALFIWCLALWAVQPDPVQPTDNEVERDYGLLAAKTEAILARVSNGFVRTMKP